jgi:predicted Zn-dependent protease
VLPDTIFRLPHRHEKRAGQIWAPVFSDRSFYSPDKRLASVDEKCQPIIIPTSPFAGYSKLLTETIPDTSGPASMDRIAMLSEILSQNPTDAFARYGLAMEYSKSGEVERALQEFAQLLANHPDYTAAYQMAAQTLVSARRIDEAKRMLVDGISSARRTSNTHAQSEMTAMLEELG